MIIRAPVHLIGAWAVTIWPLVLVSPQVPERAMASLLTHERVHLAQQRRWAVYGLGVGLLLWFALYLLVAPYGWNPFRRRWEREAMLAEGASEAEIRETLRGAPYWLRWGL